MKLKLLFLFIFLELVHISYAQVPGIRYIGFGYNAGYSRMGGINRFVRAYNAGPDKIGGYTVTDSLDRLHLPHGLGFSIGINLNDGGIFEFRYTQRKYFSEASGPGPATDPGVWKRDIKVTLPAIGFGYIKVSEATDKIDAGYGGSVDITTGNMKTRNTTESQDYKKIQGFFNIGITPFLQFYLHPFGRSSPIMIGFKPYYQMNLMRYNFEQINVEAPNYFGSKSLKARGSNLGFEVQVMLDLTKKEKKPKIKKEPVIVQPVEVEPTQTASAFVISGRTLDAATDNSISSEIEIVNSDGQKKTASPGADGKYKIELQAAGSYNVTVKSKGYITLRETIQIDGAVTKDFRLEPIAVGQSVKINNLLFEKGKAVMKPESYSELDHLVIFLQENPSIEIELGGHTSNESHEDVNMALSKNRVETVKNYLVEKGVSAERIKLKAYGSKKPVAANDTEEHKALNRRVEYTIIKK